MKKILLFLSVFLLITSSFPQTGQWQWLHQSPQGNLIKWVKVWDANNWYAVGYGGVFMKTSNAGNTWTVNQNASRVVTGSLTPSNLNAAWFFDQNTGFVVGDNSTVELTTDGGTTFNLVSGIPAPAASPATFYYGVFFMDRNHGWIGGSGGNTSRFISTTDGGATWTANATLGNTTYNDTWSPDGQIIVLATPGGNIIRSTNGGTSWTTISTGAPGSFYKLRFSNSTTGMAVGGLSSGGSPSVAVTNDAGLTWTNVVPAVITGVNSLRDVDYSGGSFYITGVHSPAPIIYKTSDLGVTWDTLQYVAPGQAYVNKYFGCDINAGVVLVGGTDGLLNSVIGTTRTCYTTNLKQGANNDIWGNASDRIITVGAATLGSALDQIMFSTNGGNTWSFPTSTGITNATVLNSLKMVDDNIGYTCSKTGGVYKTTDGGNTWNALTTSPTIPAGQNLVKVDFISSTTGWVFSASGDPGGNSTAAIWKTTDGGLSWARQSYDDSGAYSYIYLKSASMVNANYGWALPNSGGPWKTTDGGATWTQETLGSSGAGRNIKMLDVSNGYISGNNGNLWKTTNGGTTWPLVTLPVQGSGLASLLAMYWKNVNVGMVSALGSALLTTDGGQTWSYKMTGAATNNSLYMYDGAGGTSALIAATEGGVYRFTNIYTLPVSLTLNALIQGFYNGTSMVSDTVTVGLHNSASPYALVEAQKGVLNTSGTGIFNFTTAANSTPYYIAIKHRNAVETWSASTPGFTSNALTYDFTTAQGQAYGSNLVQVGSKWCIYSGDVNADGIVDSGDLGVVDNDNANYVSGYVITDVNGDGIVDSGDLGIVDNNNANYIGKIVPTGAQK